MNGLKKLRLNLGYSQLELAIAASVSPAMIVAIERYGYMPGAAVRAKLATILKVTESVIWPELGVNK